jgi:two-component system OmpR family sensor kinase
MNTELDEARAEITRLRQQLVQAGNALEDFTYSVSHDLRASLRHVSAYLKVVREDLGEGLDASIAAHLDTAGEAAAQMARLMDALLELSRIGRADLGWCDVDLARLVSDVRHQLEPDATQRRIEWRVAPDLPTVRGDMALLGLLFKHLLANALKFTRPRDPAIIDINWSRCDGCCELLIRDNGVGFDARQQDRLFRVFQRLHSPRQFEGLGIGLALARRVVERHGGTIAARGEATGDAKSGCEISLTLPLAHAAAG